MIIYDPYISILSFPSTYGLVTIDFDSYSCDYYLSLHSIYHLF